MPVHYNMVGSTTTYYSCCQEVQFEYQCRYCHEPMGCYYCSFNMDDKHDCMQD
jgi:hypothetical protein